MIEYPPSTGKIAPAMKEAAGESVLPKMANIEETLTILASLDFAKVKDSVQIDIDRLLERFKIVLISQVDASSIE